MKWTSRRIVGIALAAFVGAGAASWALRQFEGRQDRAEPTALGLTPPPILPRQAVVYSFHGAVRCESCRRIEDWSRQLVRRDFEADLSAGRLRWQVLDFDAPANKHFVDEFRILASTIVVVELRDGVMVRAKNLQKSLQLADDRGAFEKLVGDEIRAALEGP